jgi:hypothetical protein
MKINIKVKDTDRSWWSPKRKAFATLHPSHRSLAEFRQHFMLQSPAINRFLFHGLPRGVAVSINDLLDNCAEIKVGQEVVVTAHFDGMYGGDNLVDPQVIGWLQAAIQYRGANASVLWIDKPPQATCTPYSTHGGGRI